MRLKPDGFPDTYATTIAHGHLFAPVVARWKDGVRYYVLIGCTLFDTVEQANIVASRAASSNGVTFLAPGEFPQ